MKTLMLAVLMALSIPALADTRTDDLLRRSDAYAASEAPPLQTLYWQALRRWQAGDDVQALRDLDYAAWQGSLAAAERLCVMDAFGVGTAPNALKAAFWCARAEQGGRDMAAVKQYLERELIASE